jgi:hypothetical protein
MTPTQESRIIAGGTVSDEDLAVSDEEQRRRQAILKARGVDGQKEAWRQKDLEEIEKAEKLIAPPVIYEPRCATCQSEHRVYIERSLLRGHSYQSIANSIQNGPSRKSIANHYESHMRLADAAIRAELNAEAEALGQNIEEGFRGAITLRGMLGVMIRQGYESAIINKTTTIEPKDVVQMGNLYTKLNEESGTAATEEAKFVINVFKEAIQNVLVKGDLVERDLGIQILQAISDEVVILRQEQEVDKEFERNLLPSG